VTLEQLAVKDGTVHARSGGSVSYWELASDDLLRHEATGDVPPKQHDQHDIVGTSLARRDLPAKVTGMPVYLQDMELPGMLHARVVRPPSYSARLAELDDQEVRAMPGVEAVVRDGNFLGVIASREDQVLRAQRRLARSARWEEKAALPETTDPRYLLKLKSQDEVVGVKGDIRAAVSARTLTAEYSRPHIAHASMSPSCAVAQFENDHCKVWTHSQGIYPLRADLAKVLRMPAERISVIHVEGAGCYGHNGADDAACDAALLARAAPGRPVRLQWMREDEFAWEPYGPAMLVRLAGGLDANGNIVSWHHELWSPGHSTRPGAKEGVNLLAGWHIEQSFPVARPRNMPLPGGGSHRNAIPLYEFPNQQVTNHFIPEIPLRASALRSLGAHANVFALESFMDELAHAAGADPIEFRLRHLKDARARAVIETVAEKAGWHRGEKGDGGRGRGIGFARYKNLGCYVAVIVEIEAEEAVRVKRAWVAVDAGQAINPDGIINQTEGGLIQSVSWTLKEQVIFDRERILTRTWEDYPILTFPEAPEIEVTLIDRPELPPVGAGEGAQGPTAAAIGNAVFNALGVRLRDMPLTRERLISALAQD
jgi:nicotinate dehydrogenase subunit B